MEKDKCEFCGTTEVAYMFECPDRYYCQECYEEFIKKDEEE